MGIKKENNAFDSYRRGLLRSALLGMCALPFSNAFAEGLSKIKNDPVLSKKRLILYSLEGGNDGLSTLVPYNDPIYKKLRPSLSLSGEKLFLLNEDVALHHHLNYLSALYKENQVAVIQDVGYPNPNLSHFESRTIWGTGNPKSDRDENKGWYGNLIVKNRSLFDAAGLDVDSIGFQSDETFSASPGVSSLNTTNIVEFLKSDSSSSSIGRNPSDAQKYIHSLEETSEKIRSRLVSRLHNKVPVWDKYEDPFFKDVRMVNWFIKEGVKSPAYKIVQGGFDTHFSQRNTHDHLMKTLNGALELLVNSLKENNEWDNTIILVYSEFGRRVMENGGQGTDHGTSAPVFLLGGSVIGGLYGQRAALDNLDEYGNLKYTTDFRQIYSTIASKHFQLPTNPFLQQGFKPIDFI